MRRARPCVSRLPAAPRARLRRMKHQATGADKLVCPRLSRTSLPRSPARHARRVPRHVRGWERLARLRLAERARPA